MNHCRSNRRIALTCALIVAASVSIARSEVYDSCGRQHDNKPGGKCGPELTAPNVPRMANVSQGRAPLNPHVAPQVAPARTEQFSDLNLSVNLPGGPWSKLDPKETGSRACLLLERQNPEMILSLAGERACVDAENTNAMLLTESKTKLKRMPGAALSSDRQLSAGIINGVLYEATVGEGEAKTHYSIWVAAHHGFKYKLAVYGGQNDKPAIDAAIRSFVRDIKYIEPTKLTRTDGSQKCADRRVAERKAVVDTASQGNEHSLLRHSYIRK